MAASEFNRILIERRSILFTEFGPCNRQADKTDKQTDRQTDMSQFKLLQFVFLPLSLGPLLKEMASWDSKKNCHENETKNKAS